MKRFSFFWVVAYLSSNLLTVQGQPNATFTTSGNQILDPCGNVFIPRGLNYALLDDWDFPGNLNSGELSAEIIQANPNIVRIQWYVDYDQPARPAYSLSDLDSVISRFERAGIVSILDMHDVTCTDNYSGFAEIIQYWTSVEMADLIHKHQKSVMLNVANEYGQVEWTMNPNTAFAEWLDNYQIAIEAIRQAGVKVPIVIDAPDCGTSIDRLLQAATDLYQEDDLHNIVLSVHAYYANNTEAMMTGLASQAENSAVPLLFGEIANIQDATGPCSDVIGAYPALLEACQNKNIGWLAWVWTDDFCNDRRISSDGMFANLTPYGNDIVNNADYGLAGYAQKACLESADTGNAIHPVNANERRLTLFPNPAAGLLTVKVPAPLLQKTSDITFWTVTGRQITANRLSGSPGKIQFDISAWPQGIYWLRYTDGKNTFREKINKYGY